MKTTLRELKNPFTLQIYRIIRSMGIFSINLVIVVICTNCSSIKPTPSDLPNQVTETIQVGIPSPTPGNILPSPTISPTVIHSMDKPTPLHPDQNPDVIFVFRIRPTDEDPSTNDDYENQVISAVRTDLENRLGVPTESVELLSAGYREVPLVSPCGDITIKEEEQPLGGGLAAGYEVVFQAENTNYRYTAVGGLAYFCGEN